ncbi:MAG TPA: hypothetical protein VKZ58_01300 [Longimicrobiales bacterium]|nr:hypothetical protein [Longimicrobiales bacterium]
MATSRRDFVRMAAAGAMGLGMAPGVLAAERLASSAPVPRAPRSLRILILGGTGFTGPYQIQYALDRGHQVTTFNRGRTNPELFRGKVEQLTGDRNGDLSALEGREWDVVIDNPTTLPRWVRDVGRILQGKTGHYVFISTISVYADTSRPGMDEDSPLLSFNGDPLEVTQEQLRDNLGLYGPLKAAAEREAEKWFPGRTTIIRPGLIVGPGDQSDRFTYWPVRIARGGEVLAPGNPTDPVQIIDARDLAEWTIRVVEQQAFGVYNATGPAARLSIAEMLYGIRAVTSANVRFTWVDADFLASQRVRPWSHMPVWVPFTPQTAGFADVSIARALARGLTFRPLAVTAKDTLDWFETLPDERKSQLRAGLPAEREAEVLAAWHAHRAAS